MTAGWIVPALNEAEDGHFCLCLGCEPASGQQFAFQCCKEALAHRVIVGISDRSHGRAYTGLAAPAAEFQSGVLGGFKWSSQHLDEGGCDGHSKTPFGSIWAGGIVVTRPTTNG